MKKAVITGASSLIISDIVSLLLDNGYTITAVSRNQIQGDDRENITWRVCDLASSSPDLSFIEDAELLIHAAAISNAYNHNEYFANNVQSTINLVDAAKKYKVRKFVYISSVIASYTSGDYGISKIKSEEYLINNFDRWLIIRPSNMYGYSAETPVDKLIGAIKTKKMILCPIGDKKAIQPLYYKELATFLFEIAIVNEVSNCIKTITGPKAYNYVGLTREIAGILKKKVIVIPIPKVVLMFIYFIIRILKIRIGIYPDQIYRLYHNPELGLSQFGSTSISDYLSEKPFHRAT